MEKKRALFFSFFIFYLLFFIFLIWWIWANQTVCSFSISKKECPEVLFVIKKGDGVKKISQNLFEKGLIKTPLVFKIQVLRLGIAKKLQAGEFYLSPSLTPSQIARALIRGSFDKKITIIEGWRTEEISEYLQNQGLNIDHKKWQKLIYEQNLEGYLFPDTYMIPKDASIEQIIKIFLKNFEKKFTKELEGEGLLKGIDKQSILILASLIEKEVKYEKDRPIVAGILLKRLKNNWPLQVDATVQYAVANTKCKLGTGCDWWPKKLTKKDLEIESYYNTYLYRGLPPTPICNPGLSAIRAVIYPQESPYWYYLSDLNGTIHYAKTSLEHEENIKKYLKN